MSLRQSFRRLKQKLLDGETVYGAVMDGVACVR
jgi:hypothetical protein